MTQIEVLDTGLVYSNPKPHLRSVVAYHPSLVVFDDGEMVSTFDLGEAVEAMNYHTHLARSTDGGQTWNLQGPVFPNPPGRPTNSLVRLALTSRGLIGFGGLLYRDDPEEGFVNRQTFGYVPVDLIQLWSTDRGHTWTEPEIIKPPLKSPAWEVCHSVLELPDGRLLAPLAAWRGWNGEKPAGERALVFISDDGGLTWPQYGTTFDGRAASVMHFEQSVIPLQDGRILAIAWKHDLNKGKNLPTPYSISRDAGQTFSPPQPTGLRGQTCKGIQLRDGHILCLYRRDDQPGLWANVSTLDGDEWVNQAELPVWQGATAGMTGQDRSADELSALRFGYPSLVQLDDGDVFMVLWCVEDLLTNIRWFRLRVVT